MSRDGDGLALVGIFGVGIVVLLVTAAIKFAFSIPAERWLGW